MVMTSKCAPIFGGIATIVTLAGANATFAQTNVTFPADAGIINVKSYGAVGNGVADDTVALQTALDNARPSAGAGSALIVYLPNGTYLVSDTLVFGTGFERYLTLQGQSKSGVKIKLKNGATGFTNTSAPKAVISTLQLTEVATRPAGDSFRNYIRDLTVDTGMNNTGAVGIDYLSNNTGAIYNVDIISSDSSKRGITGLRMTNGIPGPSMIKNMTITGFNNGIELPVGGGGLSPSLTFEHIRLNNQKVYGILSNGANLINFRDLVSVNTVPVYQTNDERSFFEVIEGSFTGGASNKNAVNASPTSPFVYNPMVHLRDVTVSGYSKAVVQTGKNIATGSISEYLTYPWQTSTGASAATLRLPIKETPEVTWDDPATWRSIVSNGAVSNDSKTVFEGDWSNNGGDSAAIQAAIDSGATTVYFPKGVYTINSTIYIRGNVRRLIGMESQLQVTKDFSNSSSPMFQFCNGTSPTVVFERFDTDYGPINGSFMRHAANRTLVMKGVTVNLGSPVAAYVTGTGGTGDLFMEDVTFRAEITGQKAWLRQYNPEGGDVGTPVVHLLNNGGRVWCLGMKTEGVSTKVKTTNSGYTEILGNLLNNTNYVPPTLPALELNNSSLAVVAGTGIDQAAQQDYAVLEALSGVTRQLNGIDFPYRSSSEYQYWTDSYVPTGSWYLYHGGKEFLTLQLNCAGGATAPFSNDNYFSGGNYHTYTNTIDVASATDTAPAAVYNTERFGVSTYTIPYLTAGTVYRVRLHFCENYYGAGNVGGGGNGSRKFNVVINGASVLTNFDIHSQVGPRKALIKEFDATANASGQIVINFNQVVDNPIINGIEVFSKP